MSRSNTHGSAGSARNRARRAAAGAVAQIRPLARIAGTAARRQSGRARAWAAPQLEQAGQALQDNIAPKGAAMLSAAARRVEPAPSQRPRWRKLVGVAAVGASAVTATAAALAAAARRRAKSAASAPEPGSDA